MTSLWHALLGLACRSLSALQQGIPLRGGIDVGLGTEMFPNEVYGPALLNAYRLESQAAEYPRTALGENLGAQSGQPLRNAAKRKTVPQVRSARELLRLLSMTNEESRGVLTKPDAGMSGRGRVGARRSREKRLGSASSRRVCVRVAKRERFPGVRRSRPSARYTRVRPVVTGERRT